MNLIEVNRSIIRMLISTLKEPGSILPVSMLDCVPGSENPAPMRQYCFKHIIIDILCDVVYDVRLY